MNYYVLDNGEEIKFPIERLKTFLDSDLPKLSEDLRERIKILVIGYDRVAGGGREQADRIKLNSLPNLKELLPNLIKIKAGYLWLKVFPNLPDDIEQIDLVGNKLESIPDLVGFKKLESANFSDNLIVKFDMDLPKSMRSLSLASNCLEEYDSTVPERFTNLDLSLNPMEKGDGISMGVIDAYYRKGLHLNLYQTGIKLEVRDIRRLPQNQPASLVMLNGNNNDNQNNSNESDDNNPPSYEQITNQKLTYTNSENVHHQKIQNDLLESYKRIKTYVQEIIEKEGLRKMTKEELSKDISQKMIISKQSWYHKILPIFNNKLKERRKACRIIDKCLGEDFYDQLHPNFEDNYYNVLHNVWYLIQYDLVDNLEDIYDSLCVEINDGENYCYHGILSRIINSINGYTDMVEIVLVNSEIIGNRMIMINKKYHQQYQRKEHNDIEMAKEFFQNYQNHCSDAGDKEMIEKLGLLDDEIKHKKYLTNLAVDEALEILKEFNLSQQETNDWVNAIDF